MSSLVLVVLSLAAPIPILACECPHRTDKQNLDEAQAVFIGSVIQEPEWAHSMAVVRLTPIRLFKLDKEAEILFPKAPHDEPAKPVLLMQKPLEKCTFPFENKKTYKVYANLKKTASNEPYLQAHCCYGTKVFPSDKNVHEND